MINLKKLINKIFIRLFGYFIIKKRHKDYGFNRVLTKLISDNHPLIFDIGAEGGGSSERYIKLFSEPIIHNFEPRPDQFEIMKNKFNDKKNIYLNNVAVGSKAEIKIFNQIKGGGRSSFLTSTVDDLSKLEQIEIQVETIDAYVKKNNIKKINLLKIDVQGFEDEVLKGAQETLKSNKIDIIELELIVGNLYDKTLSFGEIENIICPYGYRLFALTNHHSTDQHSANIFVQPNLQFDVIYTRNEIYTKYAYGRNFFEKSGYRKSSQTVEEYMQDKSIRK